jgi:hypothetical protein
MTAQKAPDNYYRELRQTHTGQLQLLTLKRNRVGWFRLAVILLTIILTIRAFSTTAILGYVTLALGIGTFLFLVALDVANNNRIAHLRHLLHINNEELDVLQGNYQHRFDGSQYLPHQHAYAADLDVFGTASLYQYVNRCSSEQGRAWLAHNFLEGLSVHVVAARQEAVKELAPQLAWRQHLQALLLKTPVSIGMQQKTESWLAEEKAPFSNPAWPHLILFYSVVTVASAIAAIAGFLSLSLFSFLFVIYLIIATALSSQATKAYTRLNGIVKEIGTLQQALQWIEEKSFNASHLTHLQESARSGAETGHGQIKKLKDVLNRFDMRLNVYVFLFLNSFLLWDVRQMISLNNWRRQNRPHVKKWFEAVAEIEVLNSLATLHFNQPEWAWPQFSPTHFTFRGTAVGHPLITKEQRVTNNFHLEGLAKVALITGSNMAGKSTFLRSLGINIVLAQAGAPVCAQQLSLSPVQLMSSMRIADNLAESTSTFYAELKKLKTIIERIKSGAPLFVLLDEVLRGTNSLDRHIGLKALIKQIIREKAIAVIATHDVEVATLEETHPDGIRNYHFDVQVKGEELYFDYKLKQGVCTSLNASLLMKKIGIALEENA